jgi:ATP-dependent exoDNAse (exonuclease V) beta subunit
LFILFIGTLPLANADIHEERRLAYVAATRAKDILVLSYQKKRMMNTANGGVYYKNTQMSSFLEALRDATGGQSKARNEGPKRGGGHAEMADQNRQQYDSGISDNSGDGGEKKGVDNKDCVWLN